MPRGTCRADGNWPGESEASAKEMARLEALGKKGQKEEPKKKKEKKKDGEEGAEENAEPQVKLVFPEEPSKSDKEGFEAKKAELDKEIEGHKTELEKFTLLIHQQQEGKEDYEAQKRILQDDFQKAKEAFEELLHQKNQVWEEMSKSREQSKKNWAELKAAEKDVNSGQRGALGTEQEVDDAIAALEYRMHTQSLKLTEEKNLMKEIALLKKRRPEIEKMQKKVDKLKLDAELGKQNKKPLDEQLTEVKETLDEARKVKAEKLATLNVLRDSRSDKREEIQKLIVQKDAVKAKINTARDAIREIRDAFNLVRREHEKWEWDCREIRRKERDAKWQKECESWDAQEKKRSLEKDQDKPYFEEMTLLEQTITYCKDLIKEKEEKVEEGPKDLDFDAPEGAKIMLSKKDREAEFLVAPKGKKFKKRNKEAASNIKHQAGTFALFTELNVKAPMTMDQVPETIEVLEKKLEKYQAKIREWEEKREKIVAEVAAAEAN